MTKERELWPGAGMWLDFRNISEKDRDQVEQRLQQIDGLQAKIVFLKQLLETYKYALIAIFDDLEKQQEELRRTYRNEGATPETARIKSRRPTEEFTERGKSFEIYLDEKVKYLSRMRAVAGEMGPLNPASKPAKDVEDEPDLSAWDNSTRALAIYALLRFAGLPKGFKITAVAKLASLITGRSQRKMENAIREADSGTFSDEDRDAVAEIFDSMGLREVAAEVRQKFYNLGTGYRTRTKSRP